ncbi:MAG: cellulase [Myxococcales bacterium]|nr:MAG: cellulase [Myxococcales bacterium]
MRGLVSALFAASALGLGGCGATVDPLGRDPQRAEPDPSPPVERTVHPLVAPASYPNAFADLLGKTEPEIDQKLDATFERLFHGSPTTEAVYFTIGDDQAYVQDILHGDVRSEGVALGMLIAVEMNHRDEFDRLWKFAASSLRYASGPSRGYFRSTCAEGPCADPYGHQELALSLLFAHGRWGSDRDIDYGTEALELLDVLWNKERDNGGVVDGVINVFDTDSWLAVDEPTVARAGLTRPENVKPGYYALFAQATAEERWVKAADAGRAFLKAAAHPKSGLLPSRAGFDGVPEPGSDTFTPEVYRAQLNMALDQVFGAEEPWYGTESDRLLGFFAGQGMTTYGASYSLDGARCLDCTRSLALVCMNGVSALSASTAGKSSFVDAVWQLEGVTGDNRYYDGILHLLSLLTLSGRLRVY